MKKHFLPLVVSVTSGIASPWLAASAQAQDAAAERSRELGIELGRD